MRRWKDWHIITITLIGAMFIWMCVIGAIGSSIDEPPKTNPSQPTPSLSASPTPQGLIAPEVVPSTSSSAPATISTTTQAPPPPPTTTPPPPIVEETEEDKDVYYASCAEAKRAGAAPLYRGEPGYRSGLDRDGDGVACEK